MIFKIFRDGAPREIKIILRAATPQNRSSWCTHSISLPPQNRDGFRAVAQVVAILGWLTDS